jgi:hypothetical protein
MKDTAPRPGPDRKHTKDAWQETRRRSQARDAISAVSDAKVASSA